MASLYPGHYDPAIVTFKADRSKTAQPKMESIPNVYQVEAEIIDEEHLAEEYHEEMRADLESVFPRKSLPELEFDGDHTISFHLYSDRGTAVIAESYRYRYRR